MIFIHREDSDPWFNLAAEEYVFQSFHEECVMLWRSDRSVVIGKHQNAREEANLPYLAENRIPLIRRISGGGAVYHDFGNINFTFICYGKKENLVNFRERLEPVIGFLNSQGIPAVLEGKSDIRVNGFKISGNAEHVFRNKILHHGTLLFSTNLERLSVSLKPFDDQCQSKSVKSARSAVANISELNDSPAGISGFMEMFKEYLVQYFHIEHFHSFSVEEREKIGSLITEKYRTWEWNIGYSPPYSVRKRVHKQSRFFDLSLEVRNGVVAKVENIGEGGDEGLAGRIREVLVGQRHGFFSYGPELLSELSEALSPEGITQKEIISLLQ